MKGFLLRKSILCASRKSKAVVTAIRREREKSVIKFKSNYPFDKKVQCERCGKKITLGQSMTGVKGIVCRECVEKEKERMSWLIGHC